MTPEKSTTLNQFIESGKNTSLDYDKLSYKNKLSNGAQVSILNVVNDYIDELKEEALQVKFTDKEYRKYRFKPKLLSIDTYGNPELYYIIMLLNDMIDVKEFDKKIIWMIPKSKFFKLMSEIYNAERITIANYNDNNI